MLADIGLRASGGAKTRVLYDVTCVMGHTGVLFAIGLFGLHSLKDSFPITLLLLHNNINLVP